MVEIYNDVISTLSMEEFNGAIRRLTRLCRIVGLTGNTDYQGLQVALAQANVPAIGSTLPGVGFEQLVLVSRKPRVTVDPTCYDITLDYEHLLDGANQNLYNSQGGKIYGKTKCSIQQKPTNFYSADLGAVGFGALGNQLQVLVKHTYPADDKKFPKQTQVQGGEVNVYQAHRNFNFEGYLDTIIPWVVADNLISTVNSDTWLNQGATEWICSEVAYEMMKLNPVRYKFHFEFQHNPDTWNPMAVFIDINTGRPPPNLVPGVGYYRVPYQRQVNFSAAFNATFEGWAQIIAPVLF